MDGFNGIAIFIMEEEQKMIQDKLNDGLIFRDLKEDGS